MILQNRSLGEILAELLKTERLRRRISSSEGFMKITKSIRRPAVKKAFWFFCAVKKNRAAKNGSTEWIVEGIIQSWDRANESTQIAYASAMPTPDANLS
jgi:hypothetical protein